MSNVAKAKYSTGLREPSGKHAQNRTHGQMEPRGRMWAIWH